MKNRVVARTIEIPQRKHTFQEVELSYNETEALAEADRCLNCHARPCVSACPVHVRIPDFIQEIKNKEFSTAYQIITETNLFPAICGRVCPQEKQCEGSCVLLKSGQALAIGQLERFASEYPFKNLMPRQLSETSKVAVVGSGPAGLSCASDLARAGYEVTIFEALHEFGGVLRYGIPDFRLPNQIIDQEISKLLDLGVHFEKDILVGSSITITELRDLGYKAFFLACGAGYPRFLNIPGEGSRGILSANEFLTRVNLMQALDDRSDTPILLGRKTVVIGGGNVAMDAARSALRAGSDVSILYRREISDMPARQIEIRHALEEGIKVIERVSPISFDADADNNVRALNVQKTQLRDESRRSFTPISGTEQQIEADTVIIAVGTAVNVNLTSKLPQLLLNDYGGVMVNAQMQSSIKDIFAGGDIINGGATVIQALGDGKKAAAGIIVYLQGNNS